MTPVIAGSINRTPTSPHQRCDMFIMLSQDRKGTTGVDYSTVTEIPGNRVTHEQLARMFHRYCFAASFCKGKEILKRIFFGKLSPLPNEIEEGMCAYTPPVPIPCDSSDRQFKVLYAVARI